MNFWSTVANLILKNRIIILLLILGLTFFWSNQWKNIQFTYTEAKLLPDDHPESLIYDDFKNKFGEEGNLIVIAVKDSLLFSEKNFNAWNKLSQKIDITALIDDFSDLNIPVENNLFFNAKIYGPVYDRVFSIPNIAIHDDSYVYIIEDSKIFKREIEILKKYDDVSIVNSGLLNGEVINLTKMDYYVDGMTVNMMESK